MFGVLSDPTKCGGKWGPEEFFETGHAHVRKLLRILSELDVAFTPGACLDFGCGVGRLTIPLSGQFERTVGVDVAKSMIGPARRSLKPGARCEFVVNRHPDLRQFADGSFDVVHSCLVLQHIPPEVTLRYIEEFFRVAKPGGLVLFQLPAARLSEDVISAHYALPETGYNAALDISAFPAHIQAAAGSTAVVGLTNRSPGVWPHDIPAGRHICVANHWLHEDGTVAVPDDGRALLPRGLAPGDSVEVPLTVHAPAVPGTYLLEVDLVQERVCWFAERGSQTARARVAVTAATLPLQTLPPGAPGPVPVLSSSIFERLRQRFRRGTPSFEMHVVARETVEHTIAARGGMLLHAVDDNAAGERWVSYTYVCRRNA